MNNIQINVFVGRLLEEVLGPVKNGEDVRWCVWTEKRKVPLLSTLCYGNESTAWTVVIAFNLHVLFVFTMIFMQSFRFNVVFCCVLAKSFLYYRFKEYDLHMHKHLLLHFSKAMPYSCTGFALEDSIIPPSDISRLLCVCESSVRRYLSVFEQTGDVKPVYRSPSWTPINSCDFEHYKAYTRKT